VGRRRPAPVRLAADARRPAARDYLRSPAAAAHPCLATLTEVKRGWRPDGTPLRSWLVLAGPQAGPDNPAPLLLWVHGGPLGLVELLDLAGWNPVAGRRRGGYAVLLPEPGACPPGYGWDFVQAAAGGEWGGKSYTDLIGRSPTRR